MICTHMKTGHGQISFKHSSFRVPDTAIDCFKTVHVYEIMLTGLPVNTKIKCELTIRQIAVYSNDGFSIAACIYVGQT